MIRRPAPAKVTAVSAILTLAVGMAETSCGSAKHANDSVPLMFGQEEPSFYIVDGDTLFSAFIPAIKLPHCGPLTSDDYKEMSDSLGVETEALRAVVEIETGATHVGFHSDGQPLINFDLSQFRRLAARRGINLGRYRSDYPQLFSPLNIRRYGSHQAAHRARFDAARQIDSVAAVEATFWGMFQIGGFNWRLAGASDLDDFVRRMSTSEYDQLLLFANFIRNTGMVRHLRTKNWASFAKLYNGPGYAKRGYHTRMAAAYRRMKREGCD